MTAPLPGVSLDDPDLTRAVAEAIHRARCCNYPRTLASHQASAIVDQGLAEIALAAVRAHLEGVGR